VAQAVAYLEHNLGSGTWSDTNRLPPIRSLAAASGVSVVSMWKAVHELQQAKKLHVVHGGYVTIWQSNQPPAIVEPGTAKWQVLKHRVYRDILEGRYHPGEPMPSLKELKGFYGCCYMTLKKALESLAGDHIITTFKKTYSVPNYARPGYSNSVAFVGLGGDDNKVVLFNPRVSEFIGSLEKEAAKANIKLEFLPYDCERPKLNSAIPSVSASNIGHIFWLGEWFRFEHHQKAMGDLILRTAQARKPVAVLDEFGFSPFPIPAASLKNLKIFTIAGKTAGRNIGKTLLRLGHRRIAYISPFYRHVWSQQRLQGLVDAFLQAGLKDAVVPFVKSELGITLDSALAMCAFKGDEYETIRRVNSTQMRLREVLEDYRLIRNSWQPNPRYSERIRNMKRSYLRLIDLIRRGIDPVVFSQISETVFQNSTAEGMRIYLEEPFFEKALKDKSITAWVADNDQTAFSALEFLRSRSIPVPGAISVTGFDNFTTSFNYGLTTYSFNLPDFAFRTLLYILKSARSPEHSVIEVDGVVIERETTARPSK
jgi:DNA-binding LacI/PurR family transcriptional regulator/DNA-binding transcriptional regulator YhcF (GntR family)